MKRAGVVWGRMNRSRRNRAEGSTTEGDGAKDGSGREKAEARRDLQVDDDEEDERGGMLASLSFSSSSCCPAVSSGDNRCSSWTAVLVSGGDGMTAEAAIGVEAVAGRSTASISFAQASAENVHTLCMPSACMARFLTGSKEKRASSSASATPVVSCGFTGRQLAGPSTVAAPVNSDKISTPGDARGASSSGDGASGGGSLLPVAAASAAAAVVVAREVSPAAFGWSAANSGWLVSLCAASCVARYSNATRFMPSPWLVMSKASARAYSAASCGKPKLCSIYTTGGEEEEEEPTACIVYLPLMRLTSSRTLLPTSLYLGTFVRVGTATCTKTVRPTSSGCRSRKCSNATNLSGMPFTSSNRSTASTSRRRGRSSPPAPCR
mmetsp:Transcript_50510/g.99870  ORF Transcript_50510/g.99870 Transcript_50510/m.99870 type:complete len:380 (+) Transcript_50510:551-1690(+)